MMELTVLIPAFNEEKRLPQTLEEIRPYLDRKFQDYEVIIVDDGSKDRTVEVCFDYAKQWPQLRCISGNPHQGKGACVKRGCLQAMGENILVMDADHAIRIENIENMLFARKKGFDVVAGTRTFTGDEGEYGLGRRIIGLIQLLLAHLIVFQKPVTDSQCGYKLFSLQSAKQIFSRTMIRGAMYDVEALFLAQKFGFSVYAQSVEWANKPGSTNNIPLCIFTSPFELFTIRILDVLGKYK
ncbi:MAG TPA: glycosyltransferase [Candidatus Omnitrophota bacterium]|nr:glycosyltransferase [Candidatus Omnitrophota bacterium]